MRVSVIHLALLGAVLAAPMPSLDKSTKSAESTEVIARDPAAVATPNAALAPPPNMSLYTRQVDDDDDDDDDEDDDEDQPLSKRDDDGDEDDDDDNENDGTLEKRGASKILGSSKAEQKAYIKKQREKIKTATGAKKAKVKANLKAAQKARKQAKEAKKAQKAQRKGKGADPLPNQDAEGGLDDGFAGGMHDEEFAEEESSGTGGTGAGRGQGSAGQI